VRRDLESSVASGRITEAEFKLFQALVRECTGIAIGDSKRELVCARLGKRLRHHGYGTFRQYHEHLRERDSDGAERQALINAITTNKTEFFRESHHFDFLRSYVADCSSGEEAYSIAVTLLAALAPARWDVKILASDIDTDMLGAAQAGTYPEESLQSVPLRLRGQYFTRFSSHGQHLARIAPDVRELVTFRRINLMEATWPIRTQFDAIFCRNVTIYFDKPAQQRTVQRLLQFLRPGGLLFLGHSESLLGLQAGLEHVANTVYRNRVRPTPGPAAP
jgi:chemotaxis protein methyltransferase CheR